MALLSRPKPTAPTALPWAATALMTSGVAPAQAFLMPQLAAFFVVAVLELMVSLGEVSDRSLGCYEAHAPNRSRFGADDNALGDAFRQVISLMRLT